MYAYHSRFNISCLSIPYFLGSPPFTPPKPLKPFFFNQQALSPQRHGWEVLLRAVRDLALSPIHRAWAEDLVANAIAGSPAALSAEEAFQIYAELMKNLQPVPWIFFIYDEIDFEYI